MATELVGPYDWKMTRDEDGHRTYEIWHRVRGDKEDGPASVMLTAGLPLVGSVWNFFNDIDTWAFCYPTLEITQQNPRQEPQTGQPRFWIVKNTFSTKPLHRCQDATIDNPLLEPDRISGGFVRYTIEAARNYDGTYITSSSHERIRGQQVEFDANRPTVRIEQNVLDLELDVFTALVDHVNSTPLWGLPARTIKLSNVSWRRLLYGTCTYYYTRIFDFDVGQKNDKGVITFDRTVRDEGTKVLHGKWSTSTGEWVTVPITGYSGSPNPDKDRPDHFIRAVDRKNNPISIVLDGNGLPYTGTGTSTPGEVDIQYYPEANLLALGIPTILA